MLVLIGHVPISQFSPIVMIINHDRNGHHSRHQNPHVTVTISIYSLTDDLTSSIVSDPDVPVDLSSVRDVHLVHGLVGYLLPDGGPIPNPPPNSG